MRAFLLAMVGVVAWASGALGARRGPADEAPRATDLLRAERLAGQAEERRRLPLPGHHRSLWKHGGGGFGDGRAAPGSRAGDVIINVRPPTQRRRTEQ
jgi:hypothetical protein